MLFVRTGAEGFRGMGYGHTREEPVDPGQELIGRGGPMHGGLRSCSWGSVRRGNTNVAPV